MGLKLLVVILQFFDSGNDQYTEEVLCESVNEEVALYNLGSKL